MFLGNRETHSSREPHPRQTLSAGQPPRGRPGTTTTVCGARSAALTAGPRLLQPQTRGSPRLANRRAASALGVGPQAGCSAREHLPPPHVCAPCTFCLPLRLGKSRVPSVSAVRPGESRGFRTTIPPTPIFPNLYVGSRASFLVKKADGGTPRAFHPKGESFP